MSISKVEHLLKKHHQSTFFWACQCCNYREEEAKEVLQMVYLKIIEKKAIYNEKAAFKTWLFSVIRYTAIDFLKKENVFENLENLEIAEEEIKQDRIDYKALLLKLPKRQHQVLLLAFYHEMTLENIAKITGLHIGTVRTHYERGKEALRRHLLLLNTKKYG